MPTAPISIAILAAVALTAAGAARAQPDAARDGAKLCAANCSACHQKAGEGIPGAFPRLAGNTFVQGPKAVVASTILKGRGGMPSFSDDLSDAQISAILTFVRSSWGNQAPPITVADVASARAAPKAADKSVLPGH